MLTITKASIVASDKRKRVTGGLYIKFKSSDNVVKDDMFEGKIKNRANYFKAVGVEIEGNDLIVEAHEVGYFARQLESEKNLDLRTLIGEKLTPIKDPQKIAKINEMSCWC